MSSTNRPPTPSNLPPKRAASIQDVAGAAGVSTATVSRVLNNPELVSAETADKVRKAIAATGYKPNLFAKGLMTRKSQVLGFVLPDIHGEFYSELLKGADEEARHQGYHLLVSSEARRNGSDLNPSFGLVDGLAVMIAEPNNALWKQARDTGLPVVAIDMEVQSEGVDSILIDNISGTLEATRHLLAGTPAANLYFVGGPETNFDTRTRADAFIGALKAAGHSAGPRQVAFREYTETWGYLWAEQMHAQHLLKPCGVLCGNDDIAVGVLQAVEDLGYDVPGDVRIVGFDDTRLASIVRPKLSSVHVPMGEVGATAIRLLTKRLENPGAPSETARLETRLVVRESSGK